MRKLKYNNIVYSYDLIDPRNFKTFYVGIGINKRMYNHVKEVIRGKLPNNNIILFNKINKILKSGYTDVIYFKSIENITWEEACIYEINRIAAFGRKNLCNMTNGGDGLFNPPLKIRRKISKTLSGRKTGERSIETRKKLVNLIQEHGKKDMGKENQIN